MPASYMTTKGGRNDNLAFQIRYASSNGSTSSNGGLLRNTRCRPTSGAFLIFIGGIWCTVMLIFGTSRHINESSNLSSSPEITTSSLPKSLFVRSNPPPIQPEMKSSLHKLQEKTEDLEKRLDSLMKYQASIPRPPIDHVQSSGAADQKGHAEKIEKEEDHVSSNIKNNNNLIPYDSNTSPVPLVDPTILTRSKPDIEGDVRQLCQSIDHNDKKILDQTKISNEAKMGSPRILCLSYTLSQFHDTAVKNIAQTWGQRCDGYLAMSDKTDPTVPSVDIKHEGPEAYNNMWQKVRSIWLYVAKHHLKEYDYFLIGGDDIFIMVENLRKYLLSEEIVRATKGGEKPIYLGRRFRPPGEKIIFNSGGAGQVLNAAALEVLARGLKGEKCRPKQVGFWEDVNTAYCLYQSGVEAYDTRDALGRERFLPFTPGNHYLYRIPKNPDWYAKYTFDLREGQECCSADAISFHYVKKHLMKQYFAQVYGLCEGK